MRFVVYIFISAPEIIEMRNKMESQLEKDKDRHDRPKLPKPQEWSLCV